MKILTVDDEKLALENLVYELHEAVPEYEVYAFTNLDKALEQAEKTKFDVAFLDIQMGCILDTEFAKKLIAITPDINIIFVTGYEDYAFDAMKLHASGYILKPPMKEDIMAELDKLRYPVVKQKVKQIRIHRFGYFDVYVDEKPVFFTRQRSKELLAYLVHRSGETVTRKQIAAILYEEERYDRRLQHNLQKVLDELKKVLKDYNIEDILIHGNNSFSVNKELFDCDLYDLLNNDSKAVKQFNGFYMENYSWAEEMTGLLHEMKIKN